MAKRKIVSSTVVWWVWLNQAPAIEVATEAEAARLINERGREFTGEDTPHFDVASAVQKIVWDEPLPNGQEFHRVLTEPTTMINYRGQARKILPRITPSRLKRMPASWIELYEASANDSTVMPVLPRIKLIEQLAARWP